MREAICDTSPIQYLHQAGFLYLLFELYSRIVVPPAVVRELDRGKAIGVDLPDLRLLPWMEIRAPEKLHQNPATLDLGAGEREVLALGVEIPGSILILDERLARFHADAMALNFTGTPGILLRAKVENRIPQIAPVIEKLAALGFRVSPNSASGVKGTSMDSPFPPRPRHFNVVA